MQEDRVRELIGPIYDAAIDPAAWDPVISSLQRELAADQLVVWLRCPQRGMEGKAVARDLDVGVRTPSDSEYWRGNPWQRAMGRVSKGAVARLGNLVDERDLCRTDFYHDFVRPQRVLHGLIGMLRREPARRCFSTLAAWRSEQAPEFDDEQLDLVRVLVPHLERAVRMNELLEQAHEEQRAALDALDRLALALIATDACARVVTTNELGQALLRGGDPLRVRDGALRANTPAATRQLEGLIAAASSAASGAPRVPGGSLTLRRGHGEPLELVVTPLSSDAGARGATAAVFARSVEPWTPVDAGVIRTLYGLTPTEARVAAALAEGVALKQVAERLGMKVTTARAHLAAIFDKTGVRRQADLVRLLVGGLGRIRVG